MPEFNLPKPIEPMAIVGMAVQIKSIGHLDGLFQIICNGVSDPSDQGWVQSNPVPIDGSDPLDHAIENALSHAKLSFPFSLDTKPGFLIALNEKQDAPAGGQSKWGKIGPLKTFSGWDHPIQSVFGKASEWFANDIANVVVIASENSSNEAGWSVIVLKQENKSIRDGNTIYALIRSIGLSANKGNPTQNSPDNSWITSAIEQSAYNAFEMAGISSEKIDYLEDFSRSVEGSDGVHGGLCKVYNDTDLTTAIGSLSHSHSAISGVTAVIKTALCLYHRIIPVNANPISPEKISQSQFYVPFDSKPWFHPEDHSRRFAAVNLLESNRACSHIIISDVERATEPANPALRQVKFYLLPVSAATPQDLQNRLLELKAEIEKGGVIAALADDCYNTYRQQPLQNLTISLVAHNNGELLREVDMAIKGIPNAVLKQGDWQTPNGSFFTASPQGLKGTVAFVYPGAFNSYPGMGKDLFTLFPYLYQSMGTITSDIGNKLREKLVYPRSQSVLDDDCLKKIEAELQADAIAMLITGTGMAFLLTSVLRDIFSIHPAAAFGYSLGELSMAFATGVWKSADASSARLDSSPVFVNELAGPQNAVRQAWGMPIQPPDYRSNLWANYVLMSTPEAVAEQVRKENRVYLTHVNTPRQVVIGGDPAACQRVISVLHCSSLQAPFNYALHCEAMRSAYEGLVYLHSWPVEKVPEVTLYSAANYAPAVVTQAGLGEGIAHCLTNPLDFPRLINQVYSAGARLFVEVGAGSNCSRWIDESLKDQPHAALSVNRRGADDHTSILRLLARLISHMVKVDLAPLYHQNNPIPAGDTTADEDWQSWL